MADMAPGENEFDAPGLECHIFLASYVNFRIIKQ